MCVHCRLYVRVYVLDRTVQTITDIFSAETAGQQIVRELTEKYVSHLNEALTKSKKEYM